jgi:Trk K+ transport system NAD-binding subunit
MSDRLAPLVETGSNDEVQHSVLVVGDSFSASALANRLYEAVAVRLVTDEKSVALHARETDVRLVLAPDREHPSVDGVAVVAGELLSAEALGAAGAAGRTVAVVAMQSDSRTLLAAQLLMTEFDLQDVVTLVADPRCEQAVEAVADSTICGSTLAAEAVESVVADHVEPLEKA